jgi:FkbM family methyltransferase
VSLKEEDMRKQMISLLAGGPLEWVGREIYYMSLDIIPDRFLSAKVIQGRDYDRLTIRIAREVLAEGGNSIDVGANAGHILKSLVSISPSGSHWAFEPIPRFAVHLRKHFPMVTVMQLALSDHAGMMDFRFLPRDPAYSSLLTRPEIEAGQEVKVLPTEVRELDDCIPDDTSIAFVKIDVEGAEAEVLRGATRLLERCKPVVVFECSTTTLKDCALILEQTGLRVSLLADYVVGVKRGMDELMMIAQEQDEFYYVASPY